MTERGEYTPGFFTDSRIMDKVLSEQQIKSESVLKAKLVELEKQQANFETPDPEFGVNLKTIIDVLGMNQTELANKTGLTQAAISQIINGEREPSLKTICAILRVIPVKFERLVKL